MKVKRKIYYIFIAFLACVSLFSVGYASWTILSNPSLGVSGNITAEDVLYTNEYVTAQNIKPLLYCDYGFVDKETSKIVNEGKMDVAINLQNLDKFMTKFSCSSIKVEFNIKLNSIGLDLFDNNELPLSINVSDSKGNIIAHTINTKVAKNISLSFNHVITTFSDNYTVHFTWINNNDNDSLNSLNPNWFYNNIKDVLHTQDLFSVNVNLDSKGGN